MVETIGRAGIEDERSDIRWRIARERSEIVETSLRPGHIAPEPQAFKAGLYKLAQKFPQVVLVPTWIHNVQRVMPKGEVIPVPVLCSVTFGTPMQLAPDEDRHAFLDRARANVIALREI